MRVLVAQKFELVRREIDHQQPTLRPQHACSLAESACAIVEVMQNLVHDHDVGKSSARQREIIDIAVAHAAMTQASTIQARPCQRQHVEQKDRCRVRAPARVRAARACAQCRCRDRAASGTADRREPAWISASTAASAACNRRMRSHSAACSREIGLCRGRAGGTYRREALTVARHQRGHRDRAAPRACGRARPCRRAPVTQRKNAHDPSRNRTTSPDSANSRNAARCAAATARKISVNSVTVSSASASSASKRSRVSRQRP